jgi:hypothetical protein
MKPVQCPRCDLRWNIPDEAPRTITCPRCLAALNNPYIASAAPPAAATSGDKPPPLPIRRVIPIDQQVHRDTKGSNAGLVVLVIIVAVGILGLFISIGQGASVSVEGIIGLVAIAAAALIPLFVVAKKKATPVSALPAQDFRAPRQAGGTLDYQRPLPDPRKLSPGAFFAQTIGGIIVGIVGGAVVAGLLSNIANGELMLLGVAAPIVVGAILCTRPRVRGLGIGMVLALPAAFLLLLGFCAIIIGSGGLKGL